MLISFTLFASLASGIVLGVWLAWEADVARELADHLDGERARYGRYVHPVVTLADGEGDLDEVLN